MDFDAIPDASSLGVLACVIDGVDDGVYEFWVTDDGLIVHDPDVHQSSVGMDQAHWVISVVLEHVGPSFLGGEL